MARTLYSSGPESGRKMPARPKGITLAFYAGQPTLSTLPRERVVVGSNRCDHVYLACLMCGTDDELAAYR